MARSTDLEFRIERGKEMDRALRLKGLTRTQLAKQIGYDDKTVARVLAGEEVRDDAVIDVCQALGIEAKLVNLLDNPVDNVEVADNEYGGYLRSTHRQFDGQYYLYRESFTEIGGIFQSVLKITWSNKDHRYKFAEYYEIDQDLPSGARSHVGDVYMSSYTNLVHLLTVYEGSLRVATLTKLREPSGIMRGCILTQVETLTFFQPTVSAIVLKKLKDDRPLDIAGNIKIIHPQSTEYRYAREQLTIASDSIVKFFKGPLGSQDASGT